MSTLLSSISQQSSQLDLTSKKQGATATNSVAFVLPADDTVSTAPETPTTPTTPSSVSEGPGVAGGGLGSGQGSGNAGSDPGIYDYAGITLLIPGGSVDNLPNPIASDPTVSEVPGAVASAAILSAQSSITNGLTPSSPITSAPSPITSAPAPITSSPITSTPITSTPIATPSPITNSPTPAGLTPITASPSPIASVVERAAMNYSAVGASVSSFPLFDVNS